MLGQCKKISTALIAFCLFTVETATGETIAATCYSPSGQRIDYIDGKKVVDKDGYSNTNPTFFYTSSDPDVLIESWGAALPFPDIMSREQVDEIVPPDVTKSIVMIRTSEVIHAISVAGRDVVSTTLYLKDGYGVFTRVRVDKGSLANNPMGAVYTSKCNISVVE
jgi:hypothetical protein